MKKILIASVLFAIAACGGKKSCDELKSKICDGQDETKCNAWFDDDFSKGPKGEKMSSEELNLGCKMILEDNDAVEAMKKQATRKLDKK